MADRPKNIITMVPIQVASGKEVLEHKRILPPPPPKVPFKVKIKNA